MAESEAPSPRTDALEVIVELLGALGDASATSGRDFYDRLCEALCRTASMTRAILLLYDEARQLVVPLGSQGFPPDLLDGVYGTLEETPIAQLALSEDRVVEVTGELERWVPERYARFSGVDTLTCTPISAAGRLLGVIFADRGGTRFELTDEERHAMWTLGKTAALAATVRIATSQQGRTRLLQARIDLAREIHDRVVQRLFGVSLVLGSEHGLSEEARRRCADEMQAALADLRDAISRPLAPPSLDTGATLYDELARLDRHYKDLPLELEWDEGVEVPEDVEPLAQSVLAEALRNAHKHAKPTSVRVHVGRSNGTFVLEVRNDGARRVARGRRGTGMGLKLAAVEALQRGALVEFGPEDGSVWRVRLVVPVGEDEEEGVSPERNLRVLVVDDHDVVHWGFRLLLTEQPWVERCLTASSVEEALALARRYEPHVALVDLFLGEESGAELCEAIRRTSPRTRVLLISGAGWISPQAAKAAGASGFVSKDWSAHDVAMAVRMVGKGMTVFAPRAEQASAPLSDREREVLTHMASGATNKEIAERLYLSPHTVKEHTSSLYRKLGVRNRAEAVQRAERLGLTA